MDGQSSPYRIVIFLDAAHVHETIFAHEIGHVWIDLVEDCEDYRMFKDLSNTGRVFQWTSIQSFVLDMKVNDVLREKGFDMSIIEGHVEEALASLSLAIFSGYRPPEPREAAFLATTLASAMLDYETGAADTLQSLDRAAMVFERDLPDVYELACEMAASVRRHGYSDRASIRKAIDECASLSFQYVGEPLDLDRDLMEETPKECYEDKYPQWFAGLSVAAKLEIGKTMARQRIPAGTEWKFSCSSGGSVQIQFREASGGWTAPTLLRQAHRLPHVPSFAGLQRAMQKGISVMNKPVTPRVSASHPTVPTFPSIPGRRTYAPGLAVFLSRVRLVEQLGGEQPYGYAINNPMTYVDPDGNEPLWGWNGWWVRQNQKLLHNCIGAGLNDSNCSGLDYNKVSKMMRCIIGCELSDLPGPGDKRYPNGYNIMNPDPGSPHGGVGPCRLTGSPEYGGFKYPQLPWKQDPCANIKAGVSLLCWNIMHPHRQYNNPSQRFPNSSKPPQYILPGDWSGDRTCYNQCMASGPPKNTTKPPTKKALS